MSSTPTKNVTSSAPPWTGPMPPGIVWRAGLDVGVTGDRTFGVRPAEEVAEERAGRVGVGGTDLEVHNGIGHVAFVFLGRRAPGGAAYRDDERREPFRHLTRKKFPSTTPGAARCAPRPACRCAPRSPCSPASASRCSPAKWIRSVPERSGSQNANELTRLVHGVAAAGERLVGPRHRGRRPGELRGLSGNTIASSSRTRAMRAASAEPRERAPVVRGRERREQPGGAS